MMTNDINTVAKKMVKALIDAKGYPFAIGYIESFMAGIIDKYVTDETDLALLKIEMLGIACNQILDKMEAK